MPAKAPHPVRAAATLASAAVSACLVVFSPWTLLSCAWAAATRLAYVFVVGAFLRAEERGRGLGARYGSEEGWRTFREWARFLMHSDSLALVAACVATRGTIRGGVPPAAVTGAGIVLFIVGAGMKYWAARTLGEGAYYWRSFFAPDETRGRFRADGPYRWFRNPMYTVGYAHAYGAALVFQSLPGLALAGFSHACILVFHFVIENPHTRRLKEEAPDGLAGADAVAKGGAPTPAPRASVGARRG
jgi:protein-S-isoprenylcysteine O-methyltransferase Ste14